MNNKQVLDKIVHYQLHWSHNFSHSTSTFRKFWQIEKWTFIQWHHNIPPTPSAAAEGWNMSLGWSIICMGFTPAAAATWAAAAAAAEVATLCDLARDCIGPKAGGWYCAWRPWCTVVYKEKDGMQIQFLATLSVNKHPISVCKMGIFADTEHRLQLYIVAPILKVVRNWFQTYHLDRSILPSFKPWRTRYEPVNYGISNYWST